MGEIKAYANSLTSEPNVEETSTGHLKNIERIIKEVDIRFQVNRKIGNPEIPEKKGTDDDVTFCPNAEHFFPDYTNPSDPINPEPADTAIL